MTFDPILHAPVAVQVHLLSAALAVAIGPLALYRQRRDRLHRVVGRTWVGAMAILAVTGLFIPAQVLPLLEVFGTSFGPIHVFSIWTLLSLTRGMRAILRRDVAGHKAEMRALYWRALGIAGVLTILPGRTLNGVLFGEAEYLGLLVIAGVAIAGLAWLVLRRRPARAGAEI
jgi:uncharacterized membrane protein